MGEKLVRFRDKNGVILAVAPDKIDLLSEKVASGELVPLRPEEFPLGNRGGHGDIKAKQPKKPKNKN